MSPICVPSCVSHPVCPIFIFPLHVYPAPFVSYSVCVLIRVCPTPCVRLRVCPTPYISHSMCIPLRSLCVLILSCLRRLILLSCTPDVSCFRYVSRSFSTPYVSDSIFHSHYVSSPIPTDARVLVPPTLPFVVYLAHLYVPLTIYPIRYIRYMYPCFSHCQIPSACIRSSASNTPGRR